MLKLDGGAITCVLLGRLGDTVVATAFLNALRARYPDRPLRLILSASCRGVAPLLALDDVEIAYVDRWHKGGGLKAAAALRRPSAAVVDLNPAPSKSAAALILLSKTSIKVGFRKKRLNAVFSDQLDEPREDEPMLDRYARLAAFFDAAAQYRPMPELRAPEPRPSLRTDGRTLVGVHAGNFKKFNNRWPEEKFVALLDILQQDPSLRVLMLCGPGERPQVEAIAQACRRPPEVLPPASIERTAAVLKQLDLFVCNITGTTHLAHAVGARTFGLYAGYTDAVWRPRDPRCGGIVSKEWTSCRSIAVEDAALALAAAGVALRREPGSRPKGPVVPGTSEPV